MAECVACGDPCPPNLRWCSDSCCYAEDGRPWQEADGEDFLDEITRERGL